MAKLIIRRTADWQNSTRDLSIYLNNEKIGTIETNKFKEFEIEAGTHELIAKVYWQESEPITINVGNNTVKKIDLNSIQYGKWLFLIFIISNILYFAFGKQLCLNITFYIITILPFAAYFFYFLTFGRTKFLKLKEL